MVEIENKLHLNFSEYPEFGVLSGVHVVASGINIAGPYAACIMAEMGAKVVHVESPRIPCQTRGNYSYAQNHRNTYSITLDVYSERGGPVFDKLIEWADIWIEAGRPGAYAKHGFTDEHMWSVNPKLAIVHVSGYGQYGPDKDKAAYDVSGQAMGGYMYLNGVSPTSPPMKVNPYLSDYATAFNACICALSIYIHALRTGEGDSADISQYETMFRMLDSYPAEWYNKGYPAPGEPAPCRTGNVSDTAACFSFYDCRDGGTIFVGMVGAGNAKRGYPILGLPEPGTGDPDFPEGMNGVPKTMPVGRRIEDAMVKFCAEHTADEVERIMTEAGIPNQKALTPGDIETNAQYEARRDIVSWEDSVFGQMRGMGIVNKFTKNPAKIVSSAPTFGEHNREIMHELGFDDAYIDELYKNGETKQMDPRETAVYWKLKEWDFFWDDAQLKRLDLD